MKTDERTVHFYDLVMESYTSTPNIGNPGCTAISNILIGLTNLKPKGKTVVKRSDVLLEIADWRYDAATGLIKILINRADRNASDVAFKDFQTRLIRKGGKTKDEGVDYSSHIIIKPHAQEPRALMLMTMGAGVTASMMERLFGLLTKELQSTPSSSASFTFAHPSGAHDEHNNPVTYKVRYRFECKGHKSTLLDDALKAGHFVSMELIAHEHEKFDAGGNLQVTRQSISISAGNPGTVTGALIKNGIRKFMKKGATRQYDEVRISYRGNAGNTQSTTLQTNDLDAAFTRKEIIELPTPVEQQQSRLSPIVITEMEKLL